MESIITCITSIFILLVLIYRVMTTNKINRNNINIISSPELSEMYLNELNRMILYTVVYDVDVKFGNTFRDTRSITPDIENSELLDALEDSMTTIKKNMSNRMKEYLYITFGENWINNFIETQTLSIGLNYANLNIRELTKMVFKQKK